MDSDPAANGGRHVLVVEDDGMIGLALVTYLEELGFTVTWLATVPEALARIHEAGTIDVAIVDLNLQGEWSTPVIDLLLAKCVRTVLCTGYDPSILAERFRDLPRAEKPFTRSMIRRLIAA